MVKFSSVMGDFSSVAGYVVTCEGQYLKPVWCEGFQGWIATPDMAEAMQDEKPYLNEHTSREESMEEVYLDMLEILDEYIVKHDPPFRGKVAQLFEIDMSGNLNLEWEGELKG